MATTTIDLSHLTLESDIAEVEEAIEEHVSRVLQMGSIPFTSEAYKRYLSRHNLPDNADHRHIFEFAFTLDWVMGKLSSGTGDVW